MNTLIGGAATYMVREFLTGAMSIMVSIMSSIQKSSYRTVEHSQVVQTMIATTRNIAFMGIGLVIAFHVVRHYIMWNDGTALDDGTLIYKSILKGSFGIVGSSTFAFMFFKYGALLASALVTSPINALQHLENTAQNIPAATPGSTLIMLLGALVCVGGIVVSIIRMFSYTAELAIHAIAGPLAALSDVSPNSNVFSGWVTSLITLSLSTAFQWVGIGLVAAAAGVGGFTGIALAIGAVVMLFRGTHLMKQWIGYRSGVGTVVSAAVAAKAARATNILG